MQEPALVLELDLDPEVVGHGGILSGRRTEAPQLGVDPVEPRFELLQLAHHRILAGRLHVGLAPSDECARDRGRDDGQERQSEEHQDRADHLAVGLLRNDVAVARRS